MQACFMCVLSSVSSCCKCGSSRYTYRCKQTIQHLGCLQEYVADLGAAYRGKKLPKIFLQRVIRHFWCQVAHKYGVVQGGACMYTCITIEHSARGMTGHLLIAAGSLVINL